MYKYRTTNMKRNFCLSLLCAALLGVCVVPSKADAQVVSIKDRTYTIVGIGGQAYYNDRNRTFSYLGYQGEVGIGANFFGDVGARICAMASHNRNALDIASNYLSIHADATFNLPNIIFGHNTARKSSLNAILGIGFMRRNPNHLQPADNEVVIVPGFSYTYPLGLGLHFLLEGKAYVFLPKFDYNQKMSAMYTLTAGIQHRFNDSPYRNGMNSGSHSMYENWFASLSGGVNSLQYAGLMSTERTHLLKPAAEFSVGKYLSPIIGARLSALGINAATSQSTFKIINVHADVLLNLSNIKLPRQNRPLTFSLYLGAGLIDRIDHDVLTITANAGLLTRFWLSNRSDLLVDLRYMASTSNFVQEMGPQGRTSVGMLTATVGYCYNITLGSLR